MPNGNWKRVLICWCVCVFLFHLVFTELIASAFQVAPPPPPIPSKENVDPFPLDATGVERRIQNVPFSMTSLTMSPFSKVRKGRLFGVRCRVVNEQEKTDTVTVVANIVGRSGEQYARKLVLDGGKSRTFDIQMPLPEDYLSTSVEVTCTLWVERNGRDVLIERDGEPIEQKLRLTVEQEAVITATLLNPPPRPYLEWEWPKESNYPSYDWLISTRVGAGNQRVTLDLESYALPNELFDLDAIDNVVIADERIFGNTAAMRALKAWLLAGGRVWVMLDQVDARHVQALLMAGQIVHVIDETEITDAILDSPTAFNAESRNYRFQSTRGVKLVKVEQSGGEVTHTADSWPAAIWMPVGDGEVLLTTMGPAAWLHPAQGNSGKEELYRSDYELKPWVGPMGERFHQAKVRMLPRKPGLEYPVAQIGFRVLGRGTVSMVLIGFCVMLGGVGYWLHRSNRNEWIGWIAPALSLVVACSLALGAGLLRRDIPEGWHRIQLIHLDGKERAYIFEQSAMYRSQPTAFPLEVKSDAQIDPEVGVAIRDFRATQVNVEDSIVSSEGWPTGIWRMESQINSNEEVKAAVGTWSKLGLEVQLPSNMESLENLLLSQPRAPKSILRKETSGTWLISEDSTLPPNEFATSAGLVDERFFRRAELLQQSFDPVGGEARPKSQQVMGWGEIAPGKMAWNENGKANSGQGDALWRMPIVRRAPELNSAILVPPALIYWDTVSTEVGASGAFVRSKGEWTGPFTNAMSTGVRPQLPEEIFPLQVAQIRLKSRIRAAGRDVIFFARTSAGKKELGKFFSPQQVITLTLTDKEILEALTRKELNIVIEVSGLKETSDDPKAFVQAVPWQIEYLWMTVEGIANYQENP